MVRDCVTTLRSVLTEYQSINGEFLSERPEFRQRLRYYTPHVKAIAYTPGKRFDHRSLHALRTSTVPLPLFPNVGEVTLPCFSERPLEAIFYPAIVLSPSVRIVTIETNGIRAALTPGVTDLDNPCWKTLSNRLQTYAQNITSFSIYAPFCGRARLSSIDSLLRHFTVRLTSLSIDHLLLQPETLPVLSRLIHLKTLSVAVDDSLLSAHFPYDLPFPKLQYLCLSAMSTAGLNTFLRKLRVPSLEQFTIDFYVSARDIDLHESFAALVSNCTLPKLSAFHVIVPRADPAVRFQITGATLTPFLACKDMKEVHIFNCLPPEIEDSVLADLFSAWPKLTDFNLYPPEGDEDIYWGPLTLAGVHAAIQHCPGLESLVLPCDARLVPFLINNDDGEDGVDEEEEKEDHYRFLRHWELCNSAITSGQQVGRFLRRFYPELQNGLTFPFSAFQTKQRRNFLEPIGPADTEAAVMVDQWADVFRLVRGPYALV